jgi:tetratricopeptide (TPR) repeat protein
LKRQRKLRRTTSLLGWITTGIGFTGILGCAANPGAPRVLAVAKPVTSKQQLTVAYQHLAQKRYDQAYNEADAFLAKSSSGPGAAEAFYLKGRVFEARAESAGQTGIAREQLTTAANTYLQAISRSPAPSVEGLARAGFANAAFYLEDYATAAREYAAAFPLLPQSESRAWTLYRIGVCHQRMGAFDQADRSFAQLQQSFPKTEAAKRAGYRIGQRSFYLQVGAFTTPATASGEMSRLQRLGYAAIRGQDPNTNQQIVRAGPFLTYAEARGAQSSLVSSYPDALVIP